jgi:hypothetical protein
MPRASLQDRATAKSPPAPSHATALLGEQQEAGLIVMPSRALGQQGQQRLAEIEAALDREGEWVGDLRHWSRDGRELRIQQVLSVFRFTLPTAPPDTAQG